MNTTKFFEKYATPISIIVAGGLVGLGIALGSGSGPQKTANVPTGQPQTESQVIDELVKNPVLKKIGIKEKDLRTCIAENATVKAKVDADMDLATLAGLRGTPHMIVIMQKDGKEVQFPLFGAQPKTVIESSIAQGKTPDDQASYVESFELQTITDADHIIGNPDAPATVIEYSDIDCPFCKQLHGTLEQLVSEGKIKWVYRHAPIAQLHPFAYVKSVATECVATTSGTEAFYTYLSSLMAQ